MTIIDHDLLSIQEARILTENAREAQKVLATYSQQQLDAIVDAILTEMLRRTQELAMLSWEETEYGRWQDKEIKNRFITSFLKEKLKDRTYVGIVAENKEDKIIDIGVPVGVIAALPPATSPVSTTIYKAIIAIKSGNGMVFSPHPRAKEAICKTLDYIIKVAEDAGLPKGAIAYLHAPTIGGTTELLNHNDIDLLFITGVPKMIPLAKDTGKPLIYGGAGNGPVFIEQSANIQQAVTDIIASKTFDYGIVSAAEQFVVVEKSIAEIVRRELERQGTYFMSTTEAECLGRQLFSADGTLNGELIGKSAVQIAKLIGIAVPPETRVLIAEEKYVSDTNPYCREKLCPVLAFFIEDDWRNACEKCIELLVSEGRGHTLTIHSNNEQVIREFALKKPVSRMLVNTPATFGGMGATTNLFPAMTLGSGAKGSGFASDNISPSNLIHIRKVGYGVRPVDDFVSAPVPPKLTTSPNNREDSNRLEQVLAEIIEQLTK